jgi:hypothetical protein
MATTWLSVEWLKAGVLILPIYHKKADFKPLNLRVCFTKTLHYGAFLVPNQPLPQ